MKGNLLELKRESEREKINKVHDDQHGSESP